MLAADAPKVLLVDDEPDLLDLMELTLGKMGLDTDRALSVAEARSKLGRQSRQRGYDLCLTDMRLGDGQGLEVVQHIAEHCPHVPVAVITAHGTAENAVAALKAGAFDYLAKPVSLDQLRALVKMALRVPDFPAQARENATSLIGRSGAMAEIRTQIGKLGRTQAPVHISGESGSGKELAARLIHQEGNRASGPFIPLNCGAIPETLMESELFGYKKGAFTGADSDREGVFQSAKGGTLFLDEVADLPLSMQVKLLRALQEKKVRRVGSNKEEPVDVRIVSATHQNLGKLVEAGQFRQDLYYRLNVIELAMPSLRERPEDVGDIAAAILKRMGSSHRLSDKAEAALKAYAFPGNVRELENILERAVALAEQPVLQASDLNLSPDASLVNPGEIGSDSLYPLQDYLDRLEKSAIEQALEKTRYNKTAAARLLGVTFRSLRYRLQRLGID
ncbi:MAG TPA: sigma-54 dependent transcriptional regulator [Thiobacillaceae bacterium]|nr:sigma-54 dependent transcriptional regulator [Thiobacillaceae bacterium]